MKPIEFNYQSSLISTNELIPLFEQLLPTIDNIKAARTSDYNNHYASIDLPFDKELVTQITNLVKDKKSLNPTILVVIGIGGSNLGTMAVLESLRGIFYNIHHPIKVYFADTVDSDQINTIAELITDQLESGNNIILNVISKSGATTETIANFEILLSILKSHRPYNYHNFVIATTDEGSPLWNLSVEEKFFLLAIPKNVGGRYSVLSAVGLFPLCFLDIDIEELCAGAQSGFIISTEKNFTKNYAALSAMNITHHYKKGKLIHDTFLFSTALHYFGAWYRQLSAESIGKALNLHNNEVHIGLLPTVSIGSTDLHSVAQLYLAGPHNRFTSFISVEKNQTDLITPDWPEFERVTPHIQNKKLISLMNAILQGTKAAYSDDKRPFISWIIPEKSAYHIGQLLQIKMVEIIYVGALLNINPFDQPEVEKYKRETKKILER